MKHLVVVFFYIYLNRFNKCNVEYYAFFFFFLKNHKEISLDILNDLKAKANNFVWFCGKNVMYSGAVKKDQVAIANVNPKETYRSRSYI